MTPIQKKQIKSFYNRNVQIFQGLCIDLDDLFQEIELRIFSLDKKQKCSSMSKLERDKFLSTIIKHHLYEIIEKQDNAICHNLDEEIEYVIQKCKNCKKKMPHLKMKCVNCGLENSKQSVTRISRKVRLPKDHDEMETFLSHNQLNEKKDELSLEDLKNILTDREFFIIEQKFCYDKTFKEIGEKLNLKTSRTFELYTKITDKILKNMNS